MVGQNGHIIAQCVREGVLLLYQTSQFMKKEIYYRVLDYFQNLWESLGTRDTQEICTVIALVLAEIMTLLSYATGDVRD